MFSFRSFGKLLGGRRARTVVEREEMVVRSRGLWRASEIIVKRHTRKPGRGTH